MGEIYQRGRIWWADYRNNGKRVQESTGTANRREAEKFLALRVSEVSGAFTSSMFESRFRSCGRSIYLTPRRTNGLGNGTCRCSDIFRTFWESLCWVTSTL
jgi:hypothetical protein